MSLFILIYSSVCGRHGQSELFCQELSEFSQSNYDDGGVVQKRFSRMQLQCVCVCGWKWDIVKMRRFLPCLLVGNIPRRTSWTDFLTFPEA